jgi:protein-tyrosine phosphatase
LIDLHSHILPGLDDGSPDMGTSLDMARIAANDGIIVMACTPHVMPGIYQPSPLKISECFEEFQNRLVDAGIPLDVVIGCEAHHRPDFIQALQSQQIMTINCSRYVLFDVPCMVPPPRLEEMLFSLLEDGYVPILTHPERLKWIDVHSEVIERLVEDGVWLQLTAGSLTGHYGRHAKYWAERLLNEGMVHILGTDAHNMLSRPPVLSEAYELAREAVGADEALNLVITRPVNVLDDLDADQSPQVSFVKRRNKEPVWLWPRLLNTG